MEVLELKKKIKTKTVPNFLVFTGDEWAVQKVYIDQIIQHYELDKRYMDTVYDVIPKLGSKAFTSKKNCLYIVRDDIKFVKDDKMWKRVEDLLGNNKLILLITKPDNRLKFYSTHKSVITEFTALKPADLKKYISKEIDLSDKNMDKLIDICEGNYGRILLEIDKVNRYYSDKFDSNSRFEHLVNNGTIYVPPKDAIFDLIDAILDRKVNKAFELYENCKGVGESSFVIMSNLFNNAKAVLQVQTCESKDIAKSTGLTGWQIMNAKKHLKKYTNKELESMLKLISNIVHGIKVGKIEEKFVVDYILVRVL
jgi:DNA polymerase III delta subunit